MIISDLHISAQALDDFDHEIEGKFCQFLCRIRVESEPIELVINGDFLDFVQASLFEGDILESISTPEGLPLCFTESQSFEKLQAIYRAHSGVFSALQGFLSAKPDSEITLLPGNHDADLFWTTVRSSLEQTVAGVAPHL